MLQWIERHLPVVISRHRYERMKMHLHWICMDAGLEGQFIEGNRLFNAMDAYDVATVGLMLEPESHKLWLETIRYRASKGCRMAQRAITINSNFTKEEREKYSEALSITTTII